MTDKEFETIRLAIKSAYPNSNIIPDRYAMKVWYTLLRDLDFKVVQNALWEHMSTSVFPPGIADIRRLCADRCERPVMGFEDAWGTVQKAIRTYGSDNPQKAFADMDELTRTVVKGLGWTSLCQSKNPVADRANFREAYEAKANALQRERQLPAFVSREKRLLQEQYIAVEEKDARQIESRKLEDTDIPITAEQSEKRLSWFWKVLGRDTNDKTE